MMRSEWLNRKVRGELEPVVAGPLRHPIMQAALDAGFTRREGRLGMQDAVRRRLEATMIQKVFFRPNRAAATS